jgi:hypothetical protein
VRNRLVPVLLFTNVLSFGAIILLLLAGFASPARHASFKDIDVERVNIVGANGKPVMVLSNRRLMPGPSMNGKDYPASVSEGRSLLSGLLFFNEQGDEVGGLLFNGFRKGSGPSDYGALEHLSFDQWKQNQVIALQYNDHGTSRRAGLTIWDRPTDVPMDAELDRALHMQTASGPELEKLKREGEEARARGEAGAQRVFVGSENKTAEVRLSDIKGKVRARLYVGPDNAPHLDFLNDDGTVSASYPPAGK